MKSNRLRLTGLITAGIIVFGIFSNSCRKELTPNLGEEPASAAMLTTSMHRDIPYVADGPIVLGESKKNPYTVENMLISKMKLDQRGITTELPIEIRATHYYVRFKPETDEQYEALVGDSTVTFSDLPIESTIRINGDYYHDPEIPDSLPTYQYAAVSINYRFSDTIAYEILDELYIPEQDRVLGYEEGGRDDKYIDQLLNEAYVETENYEDTINIAEYYGNFQRRYTPGGNIQVFDTRLQRYIGMEGVRVQARRWFTIHDGYPDFNGNYRMAHSFKRPCNYSIWFARNRFSVRRNLVNTTYWINGPKISGDWNYQLHNDYQRFAGHVFRGGYRYHSKDIGGLARPDRWFGRRTVYIAKNDAGDGTSGVNWIAFPIIKVWRYSTGTTEYGSDDVFSTTCHETGHTSHAIVMNAGVVQYWQVTRQLQESWATAVEWYITHIEYADRGIATYGDNNYYPTNPPGKPNSYAYQYWTKKNSDRYTPIYIDIVDNVNQLNVFYPFKGTGIVDDQVARYTLPFIEDKLLKHIYGLSSLAQELKANKPAGVTDAQIDLLISYF